MRVSNLHARIAHLHSDHYPNRHSDCHGHVYSRAYEHQSTSAYSDTRWAERHPNTHEY